MLTIKVNGVLNQTKININIKDQLPKIYAIQGPSELKDNNFKYNCRFESYKLFIYKGW